MLSLIKNLLNQNKAPNINDGFNYSINLSGIKASFLRAKGTYNFDDKHINKTEFNINDKSIYEKVYQDSNFSEINKIDVCSVYNGYLDFEHGVLSTNISLQTCDEYDDLFHPVNLEQNVMEFLDLYYGPHSLKGHRGRRFECPLFWEIKNYNNIRYIYFFVNELWNTLGTHHFIIPIRKNCYLDIFFKIISMDYDSGAELEFENYINDFMSNLHFDFDEQYTTEKNISLSQKPDSHYSATKEPLKWTEYDTNPLKFYRKQEVEYLEDRLDQIKLAIANGLPKYSYLSPSDNHPEILDTEFDYEKEKNYLMNKKKSLSNSTLYHMDAKTRVKVKNS